jgi:hypothetical protein
MIEFRLSDGRGGKHAAKVNGEGELSVVVHPHPPKDEEESALPFRERFSTDAGATAMAVNGSVTNAEYSIRAQEGFDIYIKHISVVIGDNGSPALNKFGALSALSNGVKWTWDNRTVGVIELHDGIKTNLEFIRTGNMTAGVGDGTTAFLSDVSGGGTEASYLPQIDLAGLFGMPYGVRLRKGSSDRMTFTVRDDLSTLVTFNIIAYGLTL